MKFDVVCTRPECVNLYDTDIGIWFDDPSSAGPAPIVFKRMIRLLKKSGFAVTIDEDVKKNHRCLSKWHRYARHGNLECSLGVSGRHVEIQFFQNINTVNPNGGKYDFGKLAKMPYLVRLRFLWIRNKILAYFSGLGGPVKFSDYDYTSPPLEQFNKAWTSQRFERDETGWPSEKELKFWSRLDGDGVFIRQGEWRCAKVKGRWVGGRVHGGINGMWMGYVGNTCVFNRLASDLRSTFPGPGRIFGREERKKTLSRRLDEAVKSKEFLLAHRLQREFDSLA